MSYGLQSYKTSKATTASKEDLLIMLYEGAVRFLELSITEMEAKHLAEHKMYLRKGLAIISELQSTLDFQKGGEVAIMLFELYGFMLEYLTQANLTKDVSYIREVITQLNTLLEGWRVAIKQVKAGAVMATGVAPARTISKSL
ncbi:MAG: flagellar export chaperone FliS [Magnetococcales bacterium]|nr:flagellar export chaperone FliS [Magnetococcales bacterium]MBF0321815.1 flagellar export chaperone FliS [Magnetococcales bacterium]